MSQTALVPTAFVFGIVAIAYVAYLWRQQVKTYERAVSEQDAKYDRQVREQALAHEEQAIDCERLNQEMDAKYEALNREREVNYDSQYTESRARDEEHLALRRVLVELQREADEFMQLSNKN